MFNINEAIRRDQARRGEIATATLILALSLRVIQLLGGMIVPSEIQDRFFTNTTPILAHMLPVLTVGFSIFMLSSVCVAAWSLTYVVLSETRARLHESNNKAALEIVDRRLITAAVQAHSALISLSASCIVTSSSLGLLYLYGQRQKELDPTTAAFVSASGLPCAIIAKNVMCHAHALWKARHREANHVVVEAAANRIEGAAGPNPIHR